MNRWIVVGGILGFLAVAIGAFGAHALKATLEANGTTAIFQTGVQYHSTHALALLLVALLSEHFPHAKPLRTAGWLFVAGVVVFSGSLYALALTNIRFLGAITPIGGLCFLVGWVIVALAGRKT
jgi:uncharacterized membrane protein YgdD (TMEM256/DUF423 family)